MEEARKNRQCRKLAFKISAIYAAVGALWIFFSGRVAAMFANTPQDLAQIETIKGWLFVLLTALLLYNLVSRSVKRLDASQEAFHNGEEKYRALVETTETGYAILDRQGKVLDANMHYVKLTGHNSLQEILGRSVTEWTAAYDVERITEEIGKCTEKCFTRQLRVDYASKSGGIIPIEMNSTLVHSAEGTVILALCVDISERKRAEDALKESEMRFRTLFEHTAVGLAQVESDTGRFVRINRKFCDIVGYSPEEMLDRDFMSLTHPEDLGMCLSDIARLTAGEVSSLTMEKRCIHRNGSIVWVNLTVAPLGVVDGERDFHVAVVEDITERKRAEESLQQSNERICRLNDVLRAIRDVGGFIEREKDPIELLKAVCDCLVQTLGYVMAWIGKPESDSKRLSALVHSGGGVDFLQRAPITWDDGPTGQGPAGTAMRERRAVVFDDLATDPRFAPWKDPVMAYGCASIASVPLVHEERLFGVLTVKADRPHAFELEEVELLSNLAGDLARAIQSLEIEDACKQTVEALRASEEKFRLAFLTSPDSINLNRLRDGIYLDINEGFTRITGYPREDVIGKTSLELDIWDDPEDRKRLVASLERHGFVENMEARFRGQDGRIIIGLMSARVLRIEQEDFILSITRDITERERMKEEKEKLEAQLFQAQKMESVGRLAGGVAHDFNNMLGVIIGRAEMALQQDVPTDKLRHNLKEILKAGQRSADLIRQLLAFARKQAAIPQILDLNSTISGMLKMLRGLVGEDIDLLLSPELDLWKVKIDPSQVDQILANLVVNARDAISGAGAIAMRTENVVIDYSRKAETPEFVPGEYVLLTVSDTGAGMSQEVLKNIFEPFFTTKELGRGTGLGLSTVYGIVKQNGGFVYVASEPGKGTTFEIYLPRFEAENAQVPSQEPAGKRPTGTETILLVEDDEALLNVCKMILENLGYTVLAAHTPVYAIHLVENHPGDIHLLITDVVMPEMNGRELAEQLSAIRPNLKCLYMSGYTADVIARHGILDEGVIFIKKPFGSDDLAARVRQVLDQLASCIEFQPII